jgi:hypothetical protein
MMKRALIFCFLILGTVTGYATVDQDSLLSQLILAIENRDVYVKKRVNRINALREQLKEQTKAGRGDRFELYYKLFQQNKKFIYDSAFHYATLLIKTAHEEKNAARIGIARMQLGYVLISSGSYKEAFDTLNLVNAKELPDSVCAIFYALMARGNYDIAEYNNDKYYRTNYLRLGHIYTDSGRSLCHPNKYSDLWMSRIYHIKSENFSAALNDAYEIIRLFSLPYEEQAMNYYDLSRSYLRLGPRSKAIEHMTRSALADIYAATKETAAMHALAKLLYEDGDIERAYIFIQQAREDALIYGARQRQLEISASHPLIASAKLNSVDAQRRKFQLFSISLGVLIILVVAFVYIILKQLKKIKAAELAVNKVNEELQTSNHNLRESNHIKEEYIGYYFNINADYLNKVEAFKSAIDQKLMARKFEDLRYVSDNFNVKRERDNLSYSFDKVFLNLFPDFISRFNSLFRPEDQVSLKDGQQLNTELRIFALIRMGISDTEKIAKILGYSVNTIYAYKNRVKSKSIVPNEQFEAFIMEIKTA